MAHATQLAPALGTDYLSGNYHPPAFAYSRGVSCILFSNKVGTALGGIF